MLDGVRSDPWFWIGLAVGVVGLYFGLVAIAATMVAGREDRDLDDEELAEDLRQARLARLRPQQRPPVRSRCGR